MLNYDNISEINSRVWSKRHLTRTFINYPTHLNVSHKNAIYYEFLGAFRSWETISHFQFKFLHNYTGADIVINFIPLNHKLFEDDTHFRDETLAHAFFDFHYFDFDLEISVKGIEFKDLFLRDQRKILPLAKDLIDELFNLNLI